MKIVTVEGNRIEEVWFKTIKACVELGYNYTIDKGEYQGTQRREFDLVNLRIKTPGERPLACQSQFMTPTTDEEIIKYFQNYLMNPNFDNEIEADNMLNHPTKIKEKFILDKVWLEEPILKQPPCLRVIDMRVRYGKLHFFVYFRSWDLVAGYPENIGGIQLLKEWCLDYINHELEARNQPLLQDGEIIAMSKGLHIYSHFWKMAEEYVGTEGSALEIPGIHVIGD